MGDDRVEAAAALVGLVIAPDYLPGVARFLDAAQAMAVIVDAVPLDTDELAPAPVFRLPGGEE